MNLKTAMKTVLWDKALDFKGRASRGEFWWFTLGIFSIAFVVAIIEMAIWGIDAYPFGGPLIIGLQLLTVMQSLAVTSRRIQDRGHSGWWQLLYLTILGTFVVMYWTLRSPKTKNNQWGINPRIAELKEEQKNLPK
tara:strand:+ start:1666 stop:2073 length:408 start_codon:yes stop_codon:yes gene_type:complete